MSLPKIKTTLLLALAALAVTAAPAAAQSAVSTPSAKTLYRNGPSGRFLMDITASGRASRIRLEATCARPTAASSTTTNSAGNCATRASPRGTAASSNSFTIFHMKTPAERNEMLAAMDDLEAFLESTPRDTAHGRRTI